VGEGEMGEVFLIPPSLGLSERLLNRDHHKEYYDGVPPGPGGQIMRRHGDQMARLHQGFYTAQGRADDTMNLGGIKVGSIELERAMQGEGVQETAAVAVQPPEGGAEWLVVFAVTSETDMDALRKKLQDRIKQRLNPLFRIHEVVPVDKLPRTASNKVMRRQLRAQYNPS
jgi:acetyl-CoA synthetase